MAVSDCAYLSPKGEGGGPEPAQRRLNPPLILNELNSGAVAAADNLETLKTVSTATL